MPMAACRVCACMILAIAASATVSAEAPSQSTPFEANHGKPYVMVTVNGRGPFRFIVDTGTGAEAFVTAELVAELGLRPTGQVRLSDPSGQGTQHAPVVAIQSLQVAGVEFNNVKAIEHKLSEEDGTCQGLLGFELFRDYLLTLDFRGHSMSLSAGALTPDGERWVLPFRMPDGIPIVALRIGSRSMDAQIDSGGTGLSLPQSIAARMKFSSEPSIFGSAHSLSTRFQVKAGRLAEDVQLGRYTFKGPFVEINPAFPLANFGSCALQKFSLTFDQKNGLVRFDADTQMLHLAATPTAIRLNNAKEERPIDPALIPVG